MNKIKKITHPEALGLLQSWKDEAIVTGQVYTPRPFWYENQETGQTYYDIYGCIGWPSQVRVNERGDDLPGYVGVVGVVKPKTEGKKIQDAVFQLLAEEETSDIPTLLEHVLRLRSDYGFGIHPQLMQSFYGDPDRFVTALALMNERLQARSDRFIVLVMPPVDFYEINAFDHYVRSFRSVIMPDKTRFYFGGLDILKNRLKEFRQNDPAVFAVGGLVHTLLFGCMWMDQMRENAFVMEDAV